MREWKLGLDDPLHLVLAADARLVKVDYLNDHTWELDVTSGEPPALDVRTTYGLRARLMRLFPRFTEAGKSYTNPAEFAAPPLIRRIYPNFIEVTFSPLPGLEVEAEFWVPESHVLAGRFTIHNESVIPHATQFELVGQLVPLEGESMSVVQRLSVSTLEGKVGSLSPVLFMTGGAVSGQGPYPALMLPLDLAPGTSRQVSWSLASLEDPAASFDLARRTVARPMDAEKTRIDLLNTSQMVEIYTGDADWDAALSFSQRAAFSLLMSPSEKLPYTSFVLARDPDRGFSQAGDGSDYQRFWNGQPPLEALYLASLLPVTGQPARDFLLNYLSVQEQDGFIDAKPGLAGQRTRFMAAPYLAGLAWDLSQRGKDQAFLGKLYPGLLSFFNAWFLPVRDQDQNGLPEWQHVLQTGFEENPLFDGWHAWAQGVDITTVQSPALGAALYHEAVCLTKMAELLGKVSDLSQLNKQADLLRKTVESTWDADGAFYHYADRDTHLSQPGKMLSDRQAPTELQLNKEFKEPVRLLIRIFGEDEALKRPRVKITGRLFEDEVTESLDRHDFDFSASGAVATSKKLFTRLGRFEFDGLGRRDRLTIQTVDLTAADHTLLLPLWAGIPSAPEARALVYRTILNAERFDHPYGIPAVPRVFAAEADPVCLAIHMPWNALVGEGLLHYGYRREAARLVAHCMSAVIQSLKRTNAFFRTYHAETGAGLGERNTLHGLAPVGLFLKTLGVEILSPGQVRLSGENPFPWPVTVKYRGLTVIRTLTQTEVIFANGQSTSFDGPVDLTVTCEQE